MDILVKEYGAIIWQKKGYFVFSLVALTLTMTLELSAPIYYKNIANGLATPFSAATLALLMDNLFAIGMLYAGIWLAWRLLDFCIIPLEGGGVNLLEKRCFAVLKQQKYVFFENSFSGSLIKQANRFSSAFEMIMDWFLFQFYLNIVAIITTFIIFYQQHPQFACIFLAWVVLFISWNVAYSIWKLRFDEAVAAADSNIGGVFSDAISNIISIKSFALEDAEQAKINQAADLVYRKKKIAWTMTFISFAIQGLMTFGIELYMVYLMIQKWQFGTFAVGEFVLFQSIMMVLIQRLWEFGRNFRSFFAGLANATEMTAIFRQPDIETDSATAQPLTITQGAIAIKHIRFSYHPQNAQQPPLFADFSLNIAAGEKIALVGQSGSGKSTLTKLLFRFLEPQQGKICFDGLDATAFTLSSLRKQISIVPQQPELFHRSIRDNITLGANVSEEKLIEITQKAHCYEFISHLPQQFDTLVGERGVKLSGGERQRIAIARAFLEEAPIVVLDEATSALDSITEELIQAAIFALIKHKTTLVIAHRLSTILKMDRIVVLEQGKILEAGTHQQLLANGNRYYTMWQQQSGGFIQHLRTDL